MKRLPPDHPIFKRGFIVQPSISTKLSNGIPAMNTPAWKNLSEEEKQAYMKIRDFAENQLPQEVREQMSSEYLSEETKTSDLSTEKE